MYGRINARLDGFRDHGLLLLRLWFAGVLMSHGIPKFEHLSHFIVVVGKAGFPLPAILGAFAASSEAMASFLVGIGLFTRPAALCTLITMLSAGLIVLHGQPFQKQELALAYAAMSVLFIFAGSGRFGLDAMLFGRQHEGRPAAAVQTGV